MLRKFMDSPWPTVMCLVGLAACLVLGATAGSRAERLLWTWVAAPAAIASTLRAFKRFIFADTYVQFDDEGDDGGGDEDEAEPLGPGVDGKGPPMAGAN